LYLFENLGAAQQLGSHVTDEFFESFLTHVCLHVHVR